jgi:hypothetical protein
MSICRFIEDCGEKGVTARGQRDCDIKKVDRDSGHRRGKLDRRVKVADKVNKPVKAGQR